MNRFGFATTGALSLLCVAVSSCTELPVPAVDARSALTVTDSADIRVATFARADLPLLAHVSEDPEWIVGEGGEPGLDPALHRVFSGVRIGPGQIAVAEGSTQEVVFVDLDRGRIDRFGGIGDGPDEFRGRSALYMADGEEVWAVDQRRLRMLKLRWGGEVVDASSLPDLLSGGRGGRILMDGTGAIYIAQLGAVLAPGAERTERPLGTLFRIDDRPDTLLTVRGREVFSTEAVMGSVLWGASTEVVPAPAGVWVGDTGSSQIELWSEPGQPSTIIRWRDPSNRTITDADREAFFGQLEESAGAEQGAQIQAARAMLYFAEERPFFGPLVAGRDGSLWIGPPQDPAVEVLGDASGRVEPATEWVVVHVQRGTAGRVVTPEGFRLLDAGQGYVMGVHRDGLGRESVREYAVERVAASAVAGGGVGEVEPGVCRPLPEGLRLTFESRSLPEGWTIRDAVIILADDITRARDGAPSEVVVANVLDDAGEPFSEGRVEWVVTGGTGEATAFDPPKEFMLLNPASRALLERVAEERATRAWPDATRDGVGWTLDHPHVVRARECLESGT